MAKAKKKYKRRPKVVAKPQKKPPMPKKTKIIIASVAGALALAAVLFALLYDDGSLPVRRVLVGEGASADHKLVVDVPEGENWLLVNKGTSRKPKYYKLGTFTMPQGYALDDAFGAGSDENIRQFHCKPAEEGKLNYVHVQGVSKPAGEVAGEARDNYMKFYPESETGDVQEMTLGSQPITYFLSKFKTDQEDGTVQYSQTMTLYLPSRRDNCVLVNIMYDIDSMEDGLADEEVFALAEEFISRIALDKE